MMNDNFLVSIGGLDKTSIIWTTDFGSGNKKLLKQKTNDQITTKELDNWDDEDEFVQKKVHRHKYADTLKEDGYTETVEPEDVEEDDKENMGLFEEEEIECGDQFMAVKPWLGAIKAPSDYLGFKSSQLVKPQVNIELDYVYGYRAKDSRNNIFLNQNRDDGTELFYFAAALGIGLETESNTQKFLFGHKDDVISMDYHPERNLIVTGELGPKPRIIIHDASTYKTICQLRQGVTKGVSIIKFSPSGQRLAAVCINDDNSIGIFEDSKGNGEWQMLSINKGDRKKITCLEWVKEDQLLTLGKRHARSWTLKNGTLKGSSTSTSKSCDFVVGSGRLDNNGNVTILGGAANGELQLWKGGGLKTAMKIHSRALDAIFCGENEMNVVITGGRDCKINFLDRDTLKVIGYLNLNQLITETSVSNKVRALQLDSQNSNLYIGTYSSEIWSLTDFDLPAAIKEAREASKTSDPSSFKFSFMKSNKKTNDKTVNILHCVNMEFITQTQLMAGHFSPNLKWTNEVWGLDVMDKNRFVSVSDDSTFRIWNSKTRRCEGTIVLDVDKKGNHMAKCPKTNDLQDACKLRAVTVSKNKKWAAVGCKDGTVRIVDIGSMKQVKIFRTRQRWIQTIRFSPDDSLLAFGSHDSKIDVFTVKDPQTSTNSVPKFSKLSRLTKHRAFLTHLDFSTCGRYIHSNCGGYELLFFDVFTGEQITSGATMLRDEYWDTWSCILGWPVQGIFQPEWDGSDVNMTDRSRNQHNVSLKMIKLTVREILC